MIFLKKFYAEGFKSFARPITLNFDSTMIGIVGPNGSGKSNIVDALKWAIGEQSVKALRGKEKSNFIFAGSNDIDPADFALIELTFDNSSKVLHHDSEEIKISRKLIKKTGETIYMLNDQPCLLKDIQTIFSDSGLAKGSLGIISQGSVNWFAEAKPEDRRHMFESAAGIGKYTKQKNETIDLLEKATTNLEKLDISLDRLRKDVRDLKKQAEKAAIYKEKSEQLKKYDLSVSVQDILSWTEQSQELTKKVDYEKIRLEDLKNTSNKAEKLSLQYKQQYDDILSELNDITIEERKLSEQINSIQLKAAKYNANLENKLSSQSIKERCDAYKELIVREKNIIDNNTKQKENYQTELNILNEEIANLDEAKKQINSDAEDIKLKLHEARQKLQILENQNNSLNAQERGVMTLLKSKSAIPGIDSTIQNIIKVSPRYETCIQTALGKSIQNLVVDTDATAIKAIEYLKRNNAGRATILPLNTIRPKEIPVNTFTILENANGFIGIASELINYDAKYKNAISSLLGNICIADTIENANNISKMIRSTHKIISLDGDIVFAGGAISGGQKSSNKLSYFNLEEKIAEAKKNYEEINSQYQQIAIDQQNVQTKYSELFSKRQIIDKTIIEFTVQLDESIKKHKQYEIDLEALEIDANEKNNEIKIQEFQTELIQLNEKHTEISNKIKELEIYRGIRYDEYSKYNQEYSDALNKQNISVTELSKYESKLSELRNNLSNVEEKIISKYHITQEQALEQYNIELDITIAEARRRISQLSRELDELGNINFEALDSLETKQNELNKLEAETKEVRDSVKQLSDTLSALDKRAKEDFMRVINNVNKTLPEIFKGLFGEGGYCEIKLSDPTQILESGIDVAAQPPGKKVNNLNLFSGGEKTLIALAVLFSLLKSSNFPLVIFDEAEAALDQANVSTFAKLIQQFSESCQFIVITHRQGTMKMCDVLYGTTMQVKGVTTVIKTNFEKIKNIAEGKA